MGRLVPSFFIVIVFYLFLGILLQNYALDPTSQPTIQPSSRPSIITAIPTFSPGGTSFSNIPTPIPTNIPMIATPPYVGGPTAIPTFSPGGPSSPTATPTYRPTAWSPYMVRLLYFSLLRVLNSILCVVMLIMNETCV